MVTLNARLGLKARFVIRVSLTSVIEEDGDVCQGRHRGQQAVGFVALLNLLILRRRHLAALDQECVTPLIVTEK